MCAQPQLQPVPEKLNNLLMQCAIQSQLYYHNEFKNEIQARWLQSYLGHEHLEVQQVGIRTDGGVLQYKGFDGMRCSWRDYLGTMLRSPPEKHRCRYKVGTADSATTPRSVTEATDAADAAAIAASSEDGTGRYIGPRGADAAAAAASRAANPYLKTPQVKYREFTELIDPRRVARSLMSIRAQLATEWTTDLEFIAREGLELQRACSEAEGCEVEESMEQVAADPNIALPPALSVAFRAASMTWTSDLAEASTPFRSSNFDLLQRCVVREACVAAIQTLAAAEHAADAEWLRGRLLTWLPRFEEPPRGRLAGLFLIDLMQAPPVMTASSAEGGAPTMQLIDPAVVVDEVLRQHERVARDWALELTQTPAGHTRLLAELLTEENEAVDGWRGS